MPARLLGIDWGTSNRRAYLVDAAGQCLRRHADDQGLLALNGDFAGSLAALRQAMQVDAAVPVVMAGMIGSAGGWQQVPYLETGVPLEQLPRHLAPVRGHSGCAIVPGYRTAAPDVDVMRGEESQLLGALGLGVRDGWVILPGTHSKWVLLRDGRIQRLSTFMTGELFSLLTTHGTLSTLMAGAAYEEGAFADGLEAARSGAQFTHSLFGVRARVVTGSMPAAHARAYLSGLLIGTEFAAAGPVHGAALHLIASGALAGPYLQAARQFGWLPAALDPDQVFLAGLRYFIDQP